ncbi:MAG: lycopene cyclase family protein [Akkermansiaceae bacterium]
MNSEYDVAMVGAGLAGLSVAVRLAALPNPPRILMIDPRTTYECDRTWCTWSVQSHPFVDCVSHRWPEWTVGSGKKTVVRRSVRFPYQHIPSAALYHKARTLLAQAPSVTWALGRSVIGLKETPELVQVDLSDGNSIEVRQVYDSRPPEIKTIDGWRQIFYGLEIRCPQSSWNPERVVLMDFQQADENGVRFFYVLPLSSDTFLVEDTWLCPPGKTPDFSDVEILSYASKKMGGPEWKILKRENGIIPMFEIPRASTGRRITPIGTRGGAVRSSSGYAFTRIQQEADAIAAAYPNHPTADKGAFFLRMMDAIFLNAVDHHPEHLPDYMHRIFQNVIPERLIRFMESCPSTLDCLAVMKALPLRPFLIAMMSTRLPMRASR